jgi:hypothetical protein
VQQGLKDFSKYRPFTAISMQYNSLKVKQGKDFQQARDFLGKAPLPWCIVKLSLSACWREIVINSKTCDRSQYKSVNLKLEL